MTTETSISPPTGDVIFPRVTLLEISLAFLQLGLTAFGFAILQKLKALVLGRHWLSEEEMNDGLAMVQLYPGPIMVDFTAYAGYKVRGIPGAIVATTSFILPTLILMLVLSSIYFALGSLPWVRPLFLGLEAIVVGVVLNVILDFGQRALKGRTEAVIALAAFAALAFQLNAVLIVLVTLLIGAFFIHPPGKDPHPAGLSSSQTPATSSPRRLGGIVIITLIVILAAVLTGLLDGEVGLMGLSFFKIGSVAFGNGMTILPLIQADAVEHFQWLTMHEFADGIALSQITPGPFLIIATFIGYKLGGVGAALLATFAMFAPSFVMTLIFSEIYGRVRNLRRVKGALAGVLAGFVGLLALVLLQLGRIGIQGTPSLVLAASAFVAVRFFKLDILWVFGGGLLIWGGLMAVGLI